MFISPTSLVKESDSNLSLSDSDNLSHLCHPFISLGKACKVSSSSCGTIGPSSCVRAVAQCGTATSCMIWCSYALHQWCRIVIWIESNGLICFIKMNTGVMVILSLKRGQHVGIVHREQCHIFALLSCSPSSYTHTKNAVYKIFSYSQGALSRLLEASALIA